MIHYNDGYKYFGTIEEEAEIHIVASITRKEHETGWTEHTYAIPRLMAFKKSCIKEITLDE